MAGNIRSSSVTQGMVPMFVVSHNGLLELPGGRVIKHVFPGCVIVVTQEESLDKRLAPLWDVLRAEIQV